MDAPERSTPRTARVYLDPSVPRCEPSRYCPTRHHCARYISEVPPFGTLADYSITDMVPVVLACPQYVAASKCVKPAPAPPPTKPWPQADSEW